MRCLPNRGCAWPPRQPKVKSSNPDVSCLNRSDFPPSTGQTFP